MVPSRFRPSLESAKARIRADHGAIRTILDRIESLARRPPDTASDALLYEVVGLQLVLDEHLAYEERELFPYVAEIEGEERALALREEHQQQRVVLEAMVNACREGDPSQGRLVEDTRWLVESLRCDMRHEEYEVTNLSEDGFVADQCTG